MSVTSRSPLRVAGANLNSGNVGTGEQLFTLGGTQTMTLYSGILDAGLSGGLAGLYCGLGKATNSGADILLASGAGRFKDVIVHTGTLSGGTPASIVFYDGNLVISGGPYPASGHKIVGTIGVSVPFSGAGLISQGLYTFDVPYQSGLCVRTVSGMPGFSLTVTPETTLVNPG